MASLTRQQHDEWMAHLHDALESVQDAIKQLDRDDLDETNAYIMDAQKALKRVGDGLDRHEQENDASFLENYAKSWFREAHVLNALVDALPRDTLIEEGTYKWRVREQGIIKPPLEMPSDFDQNKHGPVAQVTVGCNTMSVTLYLRAES